MVCTLPFRRLHSALLAHAEESNSCSVFSTTAMDSTPDPGQAERRPVRSVFWVSQSSCPHPNLSSLQIQTPRSICYPHPFFLFISCLCCPLYGTACIGCSPQTQPCPGEHLPTHPSSVSQPERLPPRRPPAACFRPVSRLPVAGRPVCCPPAPAPQQS